MLSRRVAFLAFLAIAAFAASSREVVEGGYQGIVCDKYCRLHLSMPGGQSRDFIAAGAVQDFETGGGELVRVSVEDLQLQDGSDCLRDSVATSIRLVNNSGAAAPALQKKARTASKKKRAAAPKMRRPRKR